MLIIDTHAHVYSPDEKKYPPISDPKRPPKGEGSIDHLRRESRAAGVRAACLIQTSSFYRFDNRYTCDSAKANPDWTAGVCTLDPDDAASPETLRRLARDFGMKGMRSIPAADGRLDHPGVRALWKTGLEIGIVINVLIGVAKVRELDAMLPEFPGLNVVLDHCLAPTAGPRLNDTIAAVVRLARHKNLFAKVTFIPTGSRDGYPCRDLHESCMKVIEAYGPQRCVWGSNFPCALWTPKVSYAEHVRIFTDVLPLNDSAQTEVLGGTANRLWFGGRLRG